MGPIRPPEGCHERNDSGNVLKIRPITEICEFCCKKNPKKSDETEWKIFIIMPIYLKIAVPAGGGKGRARRIEPNERLNSGFLYKDRILDFLYKIINVLVERTTVPRWDWRCSATNWAIHRHIWNTTGRNLRYNLGLRPLLRANTS